MVGAWHFSKESLLVFFTQFSVKCSLLMMMSKQSATPFWLGLTFSSCEAFICFGVVFYKSGTAQKRKFSIKDFFSKCDQIRSFLRIWSHLLKKSLMKNFIFCAAWRAGLQENVSFLAIFDNFKNCQDSPGSLRLVRLQYLSTLPHSHMTWSVPYQW